MAATCHVGGHQLCFAQESTHDEDEDVTATAKQVLEEALGLPPVDRAEFIERLFRSFDPSDDRGADSPWSEEIESRIDAYDEGRMGASPVEDVLARINRR